VLDALRAPVAATLSMQMNFEYLHVKPESNLPELSRTEPFKAVLISESEVSPEWQAKVSEWLVRSGCLYMMAWGVNCSSWDDSVDFAHMEAFHFDEIPSDRFVMTTWHENDELKAVFWFCQHSAFHNDVSIEKIVAIHISDANEEARISREFENA